MRQELCRSCNAPIVWARTVPAGVPIPVDYYPVSQGNIVLEEVSRGRVLATVTTTEEAQLTTGGPTYVAHFKTCPQASGWRKTREPY